MHAFPAVVRQTTLSYCISSTCFSSHIVNKSLFCGLLNNTWCAGFFFFLLHFRAFWWWFHCLKLPTRIVLKCYQVCVGVDCDVANEENSCVSFIQVWVTVLLAVSAMLMNPAYILNEVPLNRNTHETRLYVEWPIKAWPEACRSLPLWWNISAKITLALCYSW